jgi:nitrite reductase (NAD(P)H)
LALTKSHKPLPDDPSILLVGKKASASGGASEGNDDLPDEAQVCSCNNITKADIKATIASKKCTSLGALRACSKAGTGCGGCIPIVTDIFNSEMKKMGVKVKNDLCEHFAYSRRDLYEVIRVMKIRTFEDLMKSHGKRREEDGSIVSLLGCEACKPAIASIFASLWNDHVLDRPHAVLQDTNDRFLANIQRGGSYSVVPRVPGGEITPEKLIVLGEVARKYQLYTKITGGQRIGEFLSDFHIVFHHSSFLFLFL